MWDVGTIYRRQIKHCTICRKRLVRTYDWKACLQAGHRLITRKRPIWWIKYYVNSRPQCVSSGSVKKADAWRLLKEREGDVVKGFPLTASVGKVTFEEAAEDLLSEYVMNGRRSLHTARCRLRKHLAQCFGGRRLSTITTSDVRRFSAQRLAAGAAPGSINRDVVFLKRMFALAMQAGKLMARPHIPLLKENNVRRGFFEPDQFQRLKRRLPPHMQPVAEFAYLTGWRTPSEVLPLEWRHVDMCAVEVRLDPGTTKNGEGRVFPFTRGLRQLLERQASIAEQLKHQRNVIVPFVFCFTDGWKAGKRVTESGYAKAWRKARVTAGCPHLIPHDFRRTAVRNLVRAGVPERAAMQLTGHKTSGRV